MAGVASAQTAPSAGSILQQIQSTLPKPVMPELSVQVPPTEMAPLPKGMTIRVKGLRFVGNDLITSDSLTAAMQSHIHKELSFEELKNLAAQVARLYLDKGWVVRTYLPEQDITSGWVTIAIVEARFGQVLLDGKTPKGVSHQRLQEMAAQALPAGQRVSASALEQLLLTYSDLPGVDVAGSLVPGPGHGETSLRLRAVDKDHASHTALMDNGGSRAYGLWRAMASGAFHSPSGNADQLNYLGVNTQGSFYGRLAYAWPADLQGAKFTVNASRMNYRLTAPEFVNLNASGTATTVAAEYNKPLIRSRQKNLSIQISAEQKSFENVAAGEVTSHYGTQALTTALLGNGFDAAGGQFNYEIATVAGHVNLDGSPNSALDAKGDRTAGSFHKTRFLLSRTQAITPSLSLLASLNGQYANRNLDASEKFSLGGATGVRGFPAGEGTGNDGWLLNLEIHKRILPTLDAAVFFTEGAVKQNKYPKPVLLAPNQYKLSAAGLAIQWDGPAGLNFKATWARRLQANPNANAAGMDQDGSLAKTHTWFQASMPF